MNRMFLPFRGFRAEWDDDSRLITSFRGAAAFLSNFHDSDIVLFGESYPTVEHAFQAQKATNDKDRAFIASADRPAAAKSRGRSIYKRRDWEEVKEDIMFACLDAKFGIPEMQRRLLQTGLCKLVEGNTWGDKYWGVCDGEGRNRLGVLLMAVRYKIRLKGS